MGVAKWIGGILGFMAGGPLGMLAGIALGYLFEQGLDDNTGNTDNWQDDQARNGYGSGQSNQYSNRYSQQQTQQGNRNSFLFSILVLSSYIIRADGKVMHSEMEHLRAFIRNNFGYNAVDQADQIMRRLFDQQKKMESQRAGSYEDIVIQSCRQIASNMQYEQRLQLIAFLADIARADGIVTNQEVNALRTVARAMGLSEKEVDSMLNLSDGATNLDAAYKVLEISPDATDDEVRKAYRKLALKHHPDRVATLGEDVRKAAEKKLQEINAARDLIFKSRGL
ncbi:MAG: TerB family tellurite resistance protein [Prevotella sp.]|nr:TerB family tellurite resistance protein [Prevotella sp.]